VNRILVWNDGSNYQATFLGPHSQEIKELFGTYTIPTPFLSGANPQEVLSVIQEQHPGVQVELVEIEEYDHEP